MTETKTPQLQRHAMIDFLRGFAVWLMIIFHAAFDLRIFGLVQINFQEDLFWWTLPRFIVLLFLLCAGMSFYLSKKYHWNLNQFLRRLGVISAGALAVSVVTYFLFPTHWIYFGTLHCIALCSIAAVPLAGRPRFALILGLAMLIPTLLGYQYWWFQLEHRSLDYIPFLPWFGVMALGLFFGHCLDQWPAINKTFEHRWIQKLFVWPGRHSLSIYLLHQPIIYGILWIFFGQRS